MRSVRCDGPATVLAGSGPHRRWWFKVAARAGDFIVITPRRVGVYGFDPC